MRFDELNTFSFMLDVFLPSPNSLLVNLRESKEVLVDIRDYTAVYITYTAIHT